MLRLATSFNLSAFARAMEIFNGEKYIRLQISAFRFQTLLKNRSSY
jgi:hypothetical protein